MSSGSQPSGQSVIQQSNNPPAYAQPYLEYGLGEARGLYEDDQPSYFPNSTVVPFSGQTEQALTERQNLAETANGDNGWSPVMPAINTIRQTAQGDMIGANPFAERMAQRGADQIQARVSSNFSGAGRSGSGTHQRALQEGLGDYFNNFYGSQYANERGLQQQASLASPGLAEAAYQPANIIGQVGAVRENMAGSQLKDQMGRFNFEQNINDENLRRYMTLISGGAMGGQQSTTQPIYSNPLATGAGIAASGASVLGNLFGAGGVFR